MLRIKQLRKEKNITASQLAKHINVADSTMSLYENGKREPPFEILKNIADFFNVSIDYLLGADTSASKHGVKIPVYGSVAAGIPIEAITDIEDYEEIPEELATTGKFAALRIHGDSMSPMMIEGDIVIVRVQDTIENGETGIVFINGDEATCKKIKKTPEGVLLISVNPAFEPMFYTNDEIQTLPIRIFGKVIELRRSL